MNSLQPDIKAQPSRKVGFEIEFSDLPLEEVALIIKRTLGGDAKQETSAEWLVHNTRLGTFRLEIDANPIKKVASLFKPEAKQPETTIDDIKQKLVNAANHMVDTVGAKIAPLEIVAPPIDIDEIAELDKLRRALYEESALGTKAALHHAFGLHINPEEKSLDAATICTRIKAFSVLHPLLLDLHKVDIARRLSPYISAYPNEYVDLVTAEQYAPSLLQLIEDYHQHNPTRNRALDMLPIFAFLEENFVRDLYGKDEKINARPTYHYRLPNSEIDRADWSLNGEWQRWLLIEEVADNKACLNALCDAWHASKDRSIIDVLESEKKWKRTVTRILEAHNVQYE